MNDSIRYTELRKQVLLLGAKFLLVIGVTLAIIFAQAFFTHGTVNAQSGGEGSGGISGSCAGGLYCATNGLGWRKFDVNGGGPGANGGKGFPNSVGLNPSNMTWDKVKSICRAQNTTHVWIFVVREYVGSGAWMGFNYTAALEAAGTAAGEITTPTARSYYNNMIALGIAGTAGYTWGSNLGWFCYTDSVWNTTGTTTANRTMASPGDVIKWRHVVENKGPSASGNIHSQIQGSGFRGNPGLNSKFDVRTGAIGSGNTRTHLNNVQYTVTAADLGSTLCQQLQWDPTSSSGAKDGRARNACVTIPGEYNLTPTITNVTDNGTVRPSTTATIEGQIKHSGSVASRTNTGHRITRIIFAPGTTVNKAAGLSADVNEYPCAYYTNATKNPGGTCALIDSAVREAAYSVNQTVKYSGPSTIGDLREGTIICYGISVTRSTLTNNARRHSALKCVTVRNSFNLVPQITKLGSDNKVHKSTVEFNTGNRTITGTILNNGATRSDRNINYRIHQISYSPSTDIDKIENRGGGSTPDNPCKYFIGSNGCVDLTPGTKIRANGYLAGDANIVTHTANTTIGVYPNNTRLCYVISVQPRSSGSTDWRHSAIRCLIVQRDYDLVPTITNVTTGDVIEAEPQTRNVTGRIANGGVTKSDPNITYQMTQIIFPASTPLTSIPNINSTYAQKSTTQDPCAYYSGGACTPLTAASGLDAPGFPRSSASGSTKPYAADSTIGNAPIGTKYCYVMSVRPHDEANNNWRHSTIHCLAVGKAPKVQVLGGDLYVGRGMGNITKPSLSRVATSVTTNSTGFYGSWGEYAIAPTGPVVGMHSGSASVVGGIAQTSQIPQTSLHLLTFTNSGNTTGGCTAAKVGCYAHDSLVPNVKGHFPTSTASPLFTSGTLTSKASNANGASYRVTGDVEISASDIVKGKTIIINAPQHTVTITGNITYDSSSLTSMLEIPQVIIIAKNINIRSNVTRVDAWLVAQRTSNSAKDGIINTCSGTAAGAVTIGSLTAAAGSPCSDQLVVNGPVMAHSLHLLRTAGAGPRAEAGDPAEVFNFRPDAYLWAYGRSKSNDQVTTVSTKELPPRY